MHELLLAKALSEGGYQRILPIGTFVTKKYGKVTFSSQFMDQLFKHYKERVMGERDPFIDINHDFGMAYGWIRDLSVKEDGLYAKIEWNEKGRDTISKKEFIYISPSLDDYIETKTGKRYFPVLKGASLTNVPVMDDLKPMTLAEVVDSGYDHGKKINLQDESMNIEELMKAIEGLSDEDKQKLFEMLGVVMKPTEEPGGQGPNQPIEASEEYQSIKKVNEKLAGIIKNLSEKYDSVQEALKDVTENYKTVVGRQNEERSERLLSEAIEDGRIFPKDLEKWQERLKKNPDVIAEVIENLPKAVNMSELGSDLPAGPKELSEEDREAMALLDDMTEEEYRVYALGEKPKKKTVKKEDD